MPEVVNSFIKEFCMKRGLFFQTAPIGLLLVSINIFVLDDTSRYVQKTKSIDRQTPHNDLSDT